jgi:hypothetical protein
MSFFGSIFGGQNPTLNSAIPQAGQVATSSIGMGQKLTNQSGNFLSDLMSGDSTKQMAVLSPQINAAKARGAQAKKTMAEFGTRGGGTGSAAANIDSSTRGDITDMIGKLTGTALGEGMSAGKGLLDTGMSALDKQVDFSQTQMENWSNSVLGQGIAQGAGFAEGAGMGKMLPTPA